MKPTLLLSLCLLSLSPLPAQVLNLGSVKSAAIEHYPLTEQHGLIDKTRDFNVENAARGYLPQVNFTLQASWQSAVTRVPVNIPGVTPPTRDQYKLVADVNQVIWDGGVIRNQQLVHEANAVAEHERLNSEIFKLEERVYQLYFGILLLDEQAEQLGVVQQDIQLAMKKVEAGIQAGVAFRSQYDVLQAELLKTQQRRVELNAARRTYLDMLGYFTLETYTDSTVLEKPTITVNPLESGENHRPELRIFQAQHAQLAAQNRLVIARNLPRASVFLQAGYGKPGLNFLENEFKPWIFTGFRLSWSLNGLYTLRRDKQLIQLGEDLIRVQESSFLFNNRFQSRQQNGEIAKLQTLLSTDEEIATLRNRIKETARVQLENGVITSQDYLREVNAAEQAALARSLHEIQLLQARYNLANSLGY